MFSSRIITSAIVTGFLTLAPQNPVDAQYRNQLNLETQGGIVFPGNQLAQFTGMGPSVSAELAYPLGRHTSVNLYGRYDRFRGSTLYRVLQAPSLTAIHYGAALEAVADLPEAEPWKLLTQIGVGATTFDSDNFTAAGQAAQFNHPYPSFQVGLGVGRTFGPRVTAFLGAQMFWTLVRRDDTRIFTRFDSGIGSFDKAWTLPLNAGFRVNL